ncbi:hypothetical protein [Chitinophaga sancti]|uniref:Uncharacterized protein n=2 Tax=Chitinophaga sancti TaxID=1004 RepID=A0A1K1S882_9BACT|nr:hypothetical protein [Chitinophaga sancti]WQG92289.1 hypothetical protein SR876_12300 [Chitinophaga sancti]SFW80279.1 hypothetical protein SAMN05661012_04931 [Chitinophaga sancti]
MRQQPNRPSGNPDRSGPNMTIEVFLPATFQMACKQLGVDEQEAIQFWIDHILIVSYLLNEEEDIYSLATSVFAAYTHTIHITAIPDKVKREICIYYTQQTIALVSEADHTKSYTPLIKEWYQQLDKHNNR